MIISTTVSRFFNKNLFIKVLICNVLLFIGAIGFFGCGFETDDDSHMMLLTDGSILQRPFDFTVNTSLYYGKYLAGLYSIFPSLNWYLINLVLIHLLASVILWFLLLKEETNAKMKLVVLMLFFFLTSSMIVKIQYTSTAAVLGFTGVFLWFYAAKNKITNWQIIASCLFIIIAGLLRWQVFLLVMALFLPIAVIYVYKYKILKKYLYILAIACSLFLGLKFFENGEILKRFGEPNYLVYHTATEVINNPIKTDKITLDQAGFLEEDLDLMKSWYWMDPIVFTKERLVVLAKKIQDTRSFREFWDYVSFKMYSERYTLTIFLFLFACSWFFIRKKMTFIFYTGALSALVLFLYLCFTSRIHHRVTVSFEYFLIVLLFINSIIQKENFNVKSRSFIWLATVVILLILILQSRWLFSIGKTNMEERSKAESAANELILLKNKLVVLGDGLPHSGFNRLTTHPKYSDKNVISIGWSCNSPWNQEILDKFNVKNINIEMFERDDIVLIGLPYVQLSAFIKTHYKKDVYFEKYSGDWVYISPYVAKLKK